MWCIVTAVLVRGIISLSAVAVLAAWSQDAVAPFSPQIPRVWDDNAMRDLELPLAARIPVHHISSREYYRIPVRPNCS